MKGLAITAAVYLSSPQPFVFSFCGSLMSFLMLAFITSVLTTSARAIINIILCNFLGYLPQGNPCLEDGRVH